MNDYGDLFQVNGIPGGGVSEFNYRNKLGKCVEATINDSNKIQMGQS